MSSQNQKLNDYILNNNRLTEYDYPYYRYIRSPTEMGISNTGNRSTLSNDINGLIEYIELLVSGNSRASTSRTPLGNKYFFRTGTKCIDKNTDKKVDRYLYINNVPQQNIPFVSDMMDVSFSEFKGLIPGSMGNLNVLNPFAIMRAFLSGSTPPCQQITMETIDINNNKSSETHFVTLIDIQNMDPCSFSNQKNPITGSTCKQAFKGYDDMKLPDDTITQIYFVSLTGVALYILYKFMEKSR